MNKKHYKSNNFNRDLKTNKMRKLSINIRRFGIAGGLNGSKVCRSKPSTTRVKSGAGIFCCMVKDHRRNCKQQSMSAPWCLKSDEQERELTSNANIPSNITQLSM